VVLAQELLGGLVLTQAAQRIGRLQGLVRALVELGRLAEALQADVDLRGGREDAAALENDRGLVEIVGLLPELAALENELAYLLVLARISDAGLGALLRDHLLQAGGRIAPALAANPGLGRVTREARFLEALRRLRVLARLLVGLGGHALAARLDEHLGRLGVIALVRIEGGRGLVAPGLGEELGRFFEAVLIVADLGGAL
jgi:hypothetical protein